MSDFQKIWDHADWKQKADIIDSVAFTLCNGDDLDIHVSNVGREVMESAGLDPSAVDAALTEIAKRLRAGPE